MIENLGIRIFLRAEDRCESLIRLLRNTNAMRKFEF